MSQQVDRQPFRGMPHGTTRRRWRILAIAIVIVIAALVAAVTFRAREGTNGAVSSEQAAPTPQAPQREGDAIVVNEAFRDAGGIRTAPATSAPLLGHVRVIGAATFDPKRVAAVGTRAPGIVRSVFRVEGDTVRANDVIAEIESPALAQAQADRRIAVAHRRAAELNAGRETKLLARGLTTAREYEQAVAALAEQDALTAAATERVLALGGSAETRIGISQLRAPTGGVVAERSISPGQSVAPGLVAFRVGDLDALWVLLRIFERDVAQVHVGDRVEVRAVATPDRAFEAKVAHVGAVLDPTTRATDIRLEVRNEERLLRPGQSVSAVINASGPARVALAVPSSAITYVDDKPTVFVAEGPDRFVVRKVELGLDGGDRVEIVSGIREGEHVVTDGVIALKSELFR